ncbi:MAG: multicopper oxidase domain-containing protein [Desulfobacterota bacterium]|nr:multicopper oxidase domain-containing protein [Thermodesulfobacteriota bacterium]
MIPKYVTPLVIPPVMNTHNGTPNEYRIAVRQFQQQILPTAPGTGFPTGFPATTVWSYGPEADPAPTGGIAPAANSQFNYPAYTIETTTNVPVRVRWINDLKDQAGNYRPHLLPVDQTLHWANPPASGCLNDPAGTDCATGNPAPYTGPVPLITHVHGAHVDPHSDGYPEAWYLPAAANIPVGYATKGRLFDDVTGANPGNLGYVDFYYRQDQPATTLWYHDHAIGMTRLNVYAGPAGFWLIRGGVYDGARNAVGQPAFLPGPAPAAGQGVLPLNTPGDPVRNTIREIPLAIQDRSFNADGSLFYPASRDFFDGFLGPYVPFSDISPIWNPEAFFNTMVVNGTTWPELRIAPALYRFRMLNGCNSRFLNLALRTVVTGNPTGPELPFYQIGAEQGFLPKVVKIQTGSTTELPGDGTVPGPVAAFSPDQALLLGLAERADVLVDFRGLPNGTRIRMINTAPDEPFGGFPTTASDPGTTGQVMEFVIDDTILGGSPTDPTGATPATDPWSLVLNNEPALGQTTAVRHVSLNEEMSAQVCVNSLTQATLLLLPPGLPEWQVLFLCSQFTDGEPAGPKAAKVGTVDLTNPAAPVGVPLMWTDTMGVTKQATLQSGVKVPVTVTEDPVVGSTEEWDIYNFTADAHPIHLHLVRFQVLERSAIPGPAGAGAPFTESLQPWEKGYKDTVIAYPGMITKVKAKFELAGLYVWHCHIVEHEDNEMMRPFFVSNVQIYFPLILALNTVP